MILPIPPDARHRRYRLAVIVAAVVAILGVGLAIGPWRPGEPPRAIWRPEPPSSSPAAAPNAPAPPAPVEAERPAPPVGAAENRPERTRSSPPLPVERAPVPREPTWPGPPRATGPAPSVVPLPPIEPPPPPPRPPHRFGARDAVPPASTPEPGTLSAPPPVGAGITPSIPTSPRLGRAGVSVVTVRTDTVARGAGFIVDPGGYIVTTNRVASGTRRLDVTLSDGRTLPVTGIGRDLVSDVAVLKVDAMGLPAILLGNSSGLRIGEAVLALGLGSRAFEPLVGTIRALAVGGRAVVIDVPLGPGRVGGPLLNARGEAVGVAAGAGTVAVPIDRAKPILADLKAATARRVIGH